MLFWLWFAFAAIMIILFFPVAISFEYAFSATQKKSIFVIRVFGKDVYNSENKKDKEKKDKKEDEKKLDIDFSFEKMRGIVKNENVKRCFLRACKSLRRISDLKKLELSFDFGFSDAAATGIAGGAAYSIVYGVVARIYYFFKIKKENMDIRVVPHFDNQCLELYTKFEFKVRLAYVSLAILDILRMYKIVKGEMSKV